MRRPLVALCVLPFAAGFATAASAEKLARMWSEAQATARRIARQLNVEVSFADLWRIEPILLHPELIELRDQSIREAAGKSTQRDSLQRPLPWTSRSAPSRSASCRTVPISRR